MGNGNLATHPYIYSLYKVWPHCFCYCHNVGLYCLQPNYADKNRTHIFVLVCHKYVSAHVITITVMQITVGWLAENYTFWIVIVVALHSFVAGVFYFNIVVNSEPCHREGEQILWHWNFGGSHGSRVTCDSSNGGLRVPKLRRFAWDSHRHIYNIFYELRIKWK